MLLFVVLGAASMSAQVRIGGDGEPHTAAVLDLNVDDSDTPTGNKGALALPRVSLVTNTDELNGATPLTGMLVYNTNTTLGEGVYYWDGNEWIKPAGGSVYEGSTSVVLSGNSLQRAALSGDVTAAQNSNAVTINNGSVSLAKTTLTVTPVSLNTLGLPANSELIITIPLGCTDSNTWYTYWCQGYCVTAMSGSRAWFRRVNAVPTAAGDIAYFWCFH